MRAHDASDNRDDVITSVAPAAPSAVSAARITATMAAAAAVAGDVAYFTGRPDEQLQSALHERDEDCRTILHHAASNGECCLHVFACPWPSNMLRCALRCAPGKLTQVSGLSGTQGAQRLWSFSSSAAPARS